MGGWRATAAARVGDMDRCRNEAGFLIELMPVYLKLSMEAMRSSSDMYCVQSYNCDFTPLVLRLW